MILIYTNTTIDYTSIQYWIVLHTTFLSHSSKHAPRIQMPHALYFLHLTACTTSIPCGKWTCPSGRRPRRRRWPWPWLRTRWLQAHLTKFLFTKSDSLEALNWRWWESNGIYLSHGTDFNIFNPTLNSWTFAPSTSPLIAEEAFLLQIPWPVCSWACLRRCPLWPWLFSPCFHHSSSKSERQCSWQQKPLADIADIQ